MTSDLLRALARLYPWDVAVSDELRRSLAFLEAGIGAETVVRAGYGAAFSTVFLGPLVLVAAPPAPRPAAVGVVLAGALGVAHLVHRGPVLLAAARRTNALGDAPSLVGRAVLRMRITPTAETAAAFAGRTGSGPLAASLGEYVERARGTPETGLDAFAAEWEAWQPALRRSASLLEAAADAPAGERGRTLDRALAAVLDGTREEMATFVGEIRGPATGLYAFGVLLPLALVAVFPAARMAGVPVSITALVLLYDVGLPLALVAAGAWLLVRRPVAFPPPRVPRGHPDVTTRWWVPPATGACVGVGAWFAADVLLPPWTPPIACLGSAAGAALVLRTRDTKAVRDRVRAVESNLTDALYLVGRRVAEGESVESAVAYAAERVDGETGATLGDAARVQERLRAGVAESFLGEHGALADVPSPRARSTAELLAIAAREGRPAGRAVVAMADHIDELAAVGREARHELSQVTGTLRTTATVFGPLVAGATVALAGGMTGVTGTEGLRRTPSAAASATSTALAVGDVGLVLGVYVLLLAAVLSALAVALERGLDRALVCHHVGAALCSATAVYLASFVAADLLV